MDSQNGGGDHVFLSDEDNDERPTLESDDDEELVNEPNKGWRNNWFVRTFLAEVPIVGHFFCEPKCSDALYCVGKSVCELVAGGAAMALVPEEPEETEEVKIFKLAAAMAVGKAAGGVVYNAMSSGIRTLYDRCLKSHLISLLSDDDDADAEVEYVNHGKKGKAKGWKNNWLVRTVFVELPIVGHFFREKCSDALYFSGKSVCELAAGGIAMALVPVEPEASREEELSVRFTAVTVGMFAGGVVYKTAGSACNGTIMLFHCCLKLEERRRALKMQKEDACTPTTSSGISLSEA